MKLHMLSVFGPLFVIRTYGQSPPPLPVPNFELVEHFEVALNAVVGVVVRLAAFSRNDDENVLVSPISAAVAIAQLIFGAEGEVRKHLVELLDLPNTYQYEKDTVSYYNKEENVTDFLPLSNLHLQLSKLLKTLEAEQDPSKHFLLLKKAALFVNNTTILKDFFRRGLRNLYGTSLYPMDFAGDPIGTLWKMSTLVALNTHGHFDSISSAPLPPNTSSILVSAISLKAQWKTPFDAKLTKLGIFKSATRSFTVPYMVNQLEQILYAESSEYRIIALPYTNEELGMYIILPKSSSQYKYDTKGFLQFLKYSQVLDTISKANRRNVVVKFPKMKLSASLSIIDTLKQPPTLSNLITKVFGNSTTNDGDVFLNDAAVGGSLRVDDVIQKVRISFDEGGSEGAAVSAVTPIEYMGRAENVNIDRPFIFFIRHENTSAILFWGAVTNPTA